jgi:hypothetical protein
LSSWGRGRWRGTFAEFRHYNSPKLLVFTGFLNYDIDQFFICFFKVKKSYLEAEENKAIKEYFEVADQYNATLMEGLAKRFEDPEDVLNS